ncbi:Synaptotagmin-like protein 2 [Bienertia sinuspersici]
MLLLFKKNEELRHTLESSVLLDIVNLANPDIHVCMTKMDFLSLAPKTWLTGASIDACSYVFNRREEENLELLKILAKDNPCYDTMKAEWLKEKKNMTYRDSTFFADKCRQSMSEWEKIVMFCKVFCKVIESSVVVLMVFTIGIEGLFLLLGEVIKTTSIVVFIALKLWNGTTVGMRKSIRLLHFQQFGKLQREQKETGSFQGCALWSARKPFLIQQQKKRKDKEKHLENLRVKRVEKVFLEDEKIRKRGKGMSKRLMIF